MLIKYHFEIEYVKGLDNAKTDVFNRKEKLQKSDKVSKVLFKKNSSGKIRYNHPQLSGIYEVLVSLWT